MVRFIAFAVCVVIYTTGLAKEPEIGDTLLLKPVTKLDFGLWKMERRIERIAPEYKAKIWLITDSLSIFVDINLNGPLPEPGDKICQSYFQLVSTVLLRNWDDEFFHGNSLPGKDDNAAVTTRLIAQQNTELYLAKLKNDARLRILVSRNHTPGTKGESPVFYNENYRCEGNLGGFGKKLQFERSQ